MSIAVVRFSGSNCDRDTLYVYEKILKVPCVAVWQDESVLPSDVKAIVLPGGFSFGDYLRAGAMAAHRPIMQAVKRFVVAGGPVLGICNGFQILCEAKILPGALLANHHDRFVCAEVSLEVTGGGQGALRAYAKDESITLPIAHHDGRYFATSEQLQKLKAEGLIALRYAQTDKEGNAIVNGSAEAIAGIFGGPRRNVLGLMPHPERRAEACLGGIDGIRMLEALYV